MKGDPFFAVAFFCSLCWHILGIPTLTVVWPAPLSLNSYPEITFLGGLGSGAWQNDATFGSKSVSRTGKGRQFDADSDILHKESIPLEALEVKPKLKEHPPLQEKVRIVGTKVFDDQRSVLYKPPLPEFPGWAQALQRTFFLELKLLILPEGAVESVENLVSSGYPELDAIGERYVRKWRFMPLPAGSEQQEQWAVITLEFR